MERTNFDHFNEIALLEERIATLEEECELLRKREWKLAGILESSPHGVFLTDTSRRIEFLSRGALHMTGHEYRSALIGRLLDELTNDDGRAVLGAQLGAGLAARGYWSGEIPIVRANGTAFPGEVAFAYFLDEDHRPSSYIVTLRDLSRSKVAQREQRRLEEQLLHSQKMEAIGTLAGGVAHDMNNVLTAILNLAAVLREETADTHHRTDVEGILTAARRGRDLTRNLLAFARKGKYRRERLSVTQLIEEVRELLSHTAPKGVELRLVVDESLPAVEGDRGQLSQALMNLYLNAIDAMDGEGIITCCTEVVRLAAGALPGWSDLPEGEYVRLEIIDTGVGMDPEVLEHVFEPFFTTKDPQRGTGLGLAMVYGTVQNHGGAVLMDSKKGAGTRATIYLPALRGGQPTARISSHFPIVNAVAGAGTILLVDDEEIIRRSLKRVLTRLGYDVLLASDGAEALDLIRSRRSELALVVLDLVMPVLDGEKTFYKIRAIDPKLPVLIASGYAHDLKVDELITAGASGFVEKPFDLAKIAEEVKLAARIV